MSMEIKGSRNVDRTSLRRTSSRKSGGSGFSISSESEETSTPSVSGAAPLAALDSILALQEMEDSTEGRSRGLKYGKSLLDALDDVRDGLLAGGIPRETLANIANNLAARQDQFTDPKLKGVLDEIELRARVELAKLEMADEERSKA